MTWQYSGYKMSCGTTLQIHSDINELIVHEKNLTLPEDIFK